MTFRAYHADKSRRTFKGYAITTEHAKRKVYCPACTKMVERSDAEMESPLFQKDKRCGICLKNNRPVRTLADVLHEKREEALCAERDLEYDGPPAKNDEERY